MSVKLKLMFDLQIEPTTKIQIFNIDFQIL